MGEELVTMSARELDRLAVIRRVAERSLTQAKAAELMGLCVSDLPTSGRS